MWVWAEVDKVLSPVTSRREVVPAPTIGGEVAVVARPAVEDWAPTEGTTAERSELNANGLDGEAADTAEAAGPDEVMRGRAVGGARGVVDEGALPVRGGVFVSEPPLEGVPELCTRVC